MTLSGWFRCGSSGVVCAVGQGVAAHTGHWLTRGCPFCPAGVGKHLTKLVIRHLRIPSAADAVSPWTPSNGAAPNDRRKGGRIRGQQFPLLAEQAS